MALRVCFLLFEGLRAHLKFQMEVCTKYNWDNFAPSLRIFPPRNDNNSKTVSSLFRSSSASFLKQREYHFQSRAWTIMNNLCHRYSIHFPQHEKWAWLYIAGQMSFPKVTFNDLIGYKTMHNVGNEWLEHTPLIEFIQYYIQDPSHAFFISSLVKVYMMLFPTFSWLCRVRLSILIVIRRIIFHSGLQVWMYMFNNILLLKNKIDIFMLLCILLKYV